MACVLDVELLPVTEMRYCSASRTPGPPGESRRTYQVAHRRKRWRGVSPKPNVGSAIVLLVNDQQLTTPLLPV